MKINNTDNSTNFGNFYRLPYSAKNMKEISEQVIGPYKYVRHRDAIEFPDPVYLCIMDIFKKIANSQNADINWLYANAKNHGINMPSLEDGKIFVVSTLKDCKILEDFFKKQTSSLSVFKNKIKTLFSSKPQFEIPQNIPEHLKPVYSCIKYAEEHSLIDQFCKEHEIIDVKTPYELFCKMMNEK